MVSPTASVTVDSQVSPEALLSQFASLRHHCASNLNAHEQVETSTHCLLILFDKPASVKGEVRDHCVPVALWWPTWESASRSAVWDAHAGAEQVQC